MKNTLTAALALGLALQMHAVSLSSPDGKLVLDVSTTDSLRISLSDASTCKELLKPSTIGMAWTDGDYWGDGEKVKKTRKQSNIDTTIASPFYKKASVRDNYNSLLLKFGGYSLELRAYNDGIAYRFAGTGGKSGEVQTETAIYRLGTDAKLYAPRVRNRKKRTKASRHELFWNDMQNQYTVSPLSAIGHGSLFFTPLLAADSTACVTMAFGEADLENYPGMYLAADTAALALHGVNAPYPAATVQGGHNDLEMLVTERENYIARVEGDRTFPWRFVIVSRDDRELPASDMVYRLAAPCRLDSTEWIRPGKVAWEWWNNWGLYGVDFKAGVNNDTYKAYIDFAADNNIEYVILDEGWATKGKCDLFDVVPEIDLTELISYAEERGVGIILWAGYLAFEKDMEEVVRRYADMGVKGFKIDFLNRDDQEMIDFMYRTAELCGRHKMLVDFHGCPKPTGLQRTYPNVINYEAVFGLEQMKWTKPGVDQITYDVTLPFIRSIAGPMDYTQGAMRNAPLKQYYPCRSNPMSQGTRCRQLAEFVIFDSPLSMLCDSPGNYMREPESTAFIASVPTVFERTEVLASKVGDHIAMARRGADGKWYIGAMTGNEALELELDLDFLDEGTVYDAVIMSDGINADSYASDYRRSTGIVSDNDSLVARMAAGGGFAAILSPR